MLFSCFDDRGDSAASSRGEETNVDVAALAMERAARKRAVRDRADAISASLLAEEAKEKSGPKAALMALRSGRALPAQWYLTPYLTCKECNAVSFVDSHKMQPLVEGSSEWSGAYGEVWGEWLPACSKCTATHAFVLGAREYSATIAEARIGLERVARRQNHLATKVQAVARGHASRVREKARLAAEAAALAELARRAKVLQRSYRMCRSRLHVTALRNLRRISRAHRNVLYLALRPNKQLWGMERVFWYRRRAELALVFSDYRVLVERQGNVPTLKRVRINFQNLHDRIHHFEGLYATTIQAIVRGVEGRRHITQYRLCLALLLGIHCTASVAIQRVCRGWRGRRDALRARDDRTLEKYRRGYLEGRRIEAKKKAGNATSERVLGHYKKERKLEFTARATGLTAFGADGGRKLRSFANSVYGPVAAANTERAVAQHMRVELEAVRAPPVRGALRSALCAICAPRAAVPCCICVRRLRYCTLAWAALFPSPLLPSSCSRSRTHSRNSRFVRVCAQVGRQEKLKHGSVSRDTFVRAMRDGTAPQSSTDTDRSPRAQKRIAGLKKWYFEEEFSASQDKMFKKLGLYDKGCQYLALQAGGQRAAKLHERGEKEKSARLAGAAAAGSKAGNEGKGGDVDDERLLGDSWSGDDDDDYGEWVDDAAVLAAEAAAAAVEAELQKALALELEMKERGKAVADAGGG